MNQLLPIGLFLFTVAMLILLGPLKGVLFPLSESERELEKKRLEIRLRDERGAAGGKLKSPVESLKDLMPVLVSVAILASALYIILSQKYSDAAQKWAFGSIGMIAGFWLKK